MDLNLTPNEQQFRDELRAWLQANVPPPWTGSTAAEEKGEYFDFLRNWQKKVCEAGWAGISWPKEYGGRGAAIEWDRWARGEWPNWGLSGLCECPWSCLARSRTVSPQGVDHGSGALPPGGDATGTRVCRAA